LVFQNRREEETLNSWFLNKEKINELWSTCEWTQSESDLFTKRLGNLNQDWLSRAIENVRTNFTSNKPSIKWIIDEYKKIQEDERFKDRHKEITEKETSDNEELQSCDADLDTMRESIDCLPDSVQESVARKVFQVTGIKIDFDVPVEEWSRMKVAMAAAAIKRG
jgi:DNA repair ATPase RecN